MGYGNTAPESLNRGRLVALIAHIVSPIIPIIDLVTKGFRVLGFGLSPPDPPSRV